MRKKGGRLDNGRNRKTVSDDLAWFFCLGLEKGKREKKRETGGFLFFGREGECGMDFFENIAQKASFGILD